MSLALAAALDRLAPLLARARPDRRAGLAALLDAHAALHDHTRRRRAADFADLAARLGPLLDGLRARQRFDPFEVLRLQRREYVHSNVLAWLLDPRASHATGAAFLNRVLAEASLPPVTGDEARRVRVGREEWGGSSLIDLIVRTPRALLILENKIDSREGAEQTTREWTDFAPRAERRAFKAVFLTRHGEAPLDPRFLAWDYGRILRALDGIPATGAIAHFLDAYRHTLLLLIGGQAMTKFKGYQEETRFLIERWGDVRRLLDAVDAARSDAAGLLRHIAAGIEAADWFDPEGWSVEVESNQVYAFKRSWKKTDGDHACLGIASLTLDHLLDESESGGAWSYLYLPSSVSATADRAALLEAARRVNQGFQGSKANPVWRYVEFADLGADPDRVRDRAVAEITSLLRALEPRLDALFTGG